VAEYVPVVALKLILLDVVFVRFALVSVSVPLGLLIDKLPVFEIAGVVMSGEVIFEATARFDALA
jgi:hypothetical protein